MSSSLSSTSTQMIIATPVAVLVCGYVGSSIGHFIDGILFSRRKGRRNQQPAVEGSPVVALGVLSTAYSFGCQQWKSRTRCHGTGEHARLRRERLRHEFRTSAAKEQRVVLRGAAGLCLLLGLGLCLGFGAHQRGQRQGRHQPIAFRASAADVVVAQRGQ